MKETTVQGLSSLYWFQDQLIQHQTWSIAKSFAEPVLPSAVYANWTSFSMFLFVCLFFIRDHVIRHNLRGWISFLPPASPGWVGDLSVHGTQALQDVLGWMPDWHDQGSRAGRLLRTNLHWQWARVAFAWLRWDLYVGLHLNRSDSWKYLEVTGLFSLFGLGGESK